ncbi:MAG TPA: HAMP domain-containing sensor histidine kinase [Actinomycetota bacterium]
MRTPAKVLRNLPLLWKILVPFMALMLLLGWAGTFIIVRNLTARAETAIDQDLGRRSLDVRAQLQSHELSLVESVNLLANLQGMSDAVVRSDGAAIARFTRSVLALKTGVAFASISDMNGRALGGFSRVDPTNVQALDPRLWSKLFPAAIAAGERRASLVELNETTMLALEIAICAGAQGCEPVGVARVAVDVGDLLGGPGAVHGDAGIALYDGQGRLLVARGRAMPARIEPSSGPRIRRSSGGETMLMRSPFEVQGIRVGTVAVAIPKASASAAVRGTGYRLAMILLAAMVGVAALGGLLSRFILAQVRPLVDTNRALEEGDLAARAAVLGTDELGQVAHGLNRMAERLQASHETLEAKVQERTFEVERLLRERTEFFATLSHELRTPLAIIIAKADLLLEPLHGSREPRTRVSSATIRQSAGQVLSIVNEILDVAKAEAGHLPVVLEDVRLDGVVSDMQATIDGIMGTAELALSIELPETLPAVRADRAHLHKVLINLLDNAAKYTPAGGRVTVRGVMRNGSVDLSVTDTGVGIPAKEKDHIFEPFFRVDGTPARPGTASTGLGLALAKRLIEAQGGTIQVASRPGRGSRFTVSLPRAGS